MIFHNVDPRSIEWKQLRLGIPCSSEFDKIMTPKRKDISAQAENYMYRLLGEWITGEEVENYESQWMSRGTELEDKAISAYEMLTGLETSPGGFITDDSGMMGCSPDRLIGEDGELEIKAPLIQTQIKYALTGSIDTAYMTQLQGRMMITGRKWIDIFPYHPLLVDKSMIVRVPRDEKFIESIDEDPRTKDIVRVGLRPALEAFIAVLLQKRTELEQRFGPFVRPEREVPADHSADFITDEDVEAILASQQPQEHP